MSHFFAHLARMKLIYRWPLMRNVTHENIAEHSLQVAMVAHALALIGNTYYGKNYNPDKAASMALFHDTTEVLTGDLPTPVKYYNKAIIREYNKIELAAENTLLDMLPPELRDAYKPLLSTPDLDPTYKKLVKDADILCAHMKCIEEESCGNLEFSKAKIRCESALDERMTDEIRYFLDVFLPSIGQPFDDMD
ncbi:5'-deoxynucleotidase [Moritella sp. 24]|uniref:5'-deoxynucleotidase n=1 Tax=Moritella sp. 24 TaxID=2746230 RepID=UPI001BA937C1|nr:5'-deoxynucleotidase [Moritella sp. 24]QUM77541.1 5'-deoxynucleotidase [Moritella sp. 24]